MIGCLLGDWISFWLGWRFKKPLHCWSFMKKNKALLDKTEHALHQHSMFTILVRTLCRASTASAGVMGCAGSARRKIRFAEHYRLRLLAAVLLPAGDHGGGGVIFLTMCRAVALNGYCWQQRLLRYRCMVVLAAMAQRESESIV